MAWKNLSEEIAEEFSGYSERELDSLLAFNKYAADRQHKANVYLQEWKKDNPAKCALYAARAAEKREVQRKTDETTFFLRQRHYQRTFKLRLASGRVKPRFKHSPLAVEILLSTMPQALAAKELGWSLACVKRWRHHYRHVCKA